MKGQLWSVPGLSTNSLFKFMSSHTVKPIQRRLLLFGGQNLTVYLQAALVPSAALQQTPVAFFKFFTLGLKLQERRLHIVQQLHALRRKRAKTHTNTERGFETEMEFKVITRCREKSPNEHQH